MSCSNMTDSLKEHYPKRVNSAVRITVSNLDIKCLQDGLKLLKVGKQLDTGQLTRNMVVLQLEEA